MILVENTRLDAEQPGDKFWKASNGMGEPVDTGVGKLLDHVTVQTEVCVPHSSEDPVGNHHTLPFDEKLLCRLGSGALAVNLLL